MGCSTREQAGAEQGDGIKAERSHMAADQHSLSSQMLISLPETLAPCPAPLSPSLVMKDDFSHRRKKRCSPDKC